MIKIEDNGEKLVEGRNSGIGLTAIFGGRKEKRNLSQFMDLFISIKEKYDTKTG